jgi:hypothetical protein
MKENNLFSRRIAKHVTKQGSRPFLKIQLKEAPHI